jgi:hypothetical protein
MKRTIQIKQIKKNLPLLVVLLVFIACNKPVKGPNGVAYKNAIAYNDYIVGRQNILIKNVLKFAEAAQVNLDSAQALLDKYIPETERMITELKGMPAWKGDTSLRNAAVKSFTFYKRVFDEDYRRILEIRRNENASEEDIIEMNDIVDKISKEEEKFDKDFHNAQKDFAQKNKMKLIENDLQKKIDEVKQ